MERWRKRVAVVTGASSGIGAAIAIDLAKAGMIVVAMARREQRIQELRASLPAHLQSNFHTYKCDVSDEAAVKKAFQWVDAKFGGLHVLVNNAGMLTSTQLLNKDSGAEIRATVETNVLGVYYCTREARELMRRHNINDGHIIFINSICGHGLPSVGPGAPSFNIYTGTKHAITAMVETYRRELVSQNSKIRVTSISPGVVETEIFKKEWEDAIVGKVPMLRSEDISDVVLYVLGTKPHVQILSDSALNVILENIFIYSYLKLYGL